MKRSILFFIIIASLAVSAFCEITYKRTKVDYAGNVLEFTFYDDGNVIATKEFDENKEVKKMSGNIPDGIANLYYENGKVEREVTYKNNKLNGPSTYYYASGSLESQGNWVDDKNEGIFKYYYESGPLWKEVNFKKGKQDGLTNIYYETGELMAKATYKQDIECGEHKSYYKSGQVSSVVSCKNCTKGKLNGYQKFYYESGELWGEGNVKDDLKDGIFKYYDKSGHLTMEEPLKGDFVVGTIRYYDDNGKLVQTIECHHYYQDSIYGLNKIYYDTGELQAEGMIHNNKRDGLFRIYKKNGKLEAAINYHDSKKNGIARYYDEDGNISRKIEYKDDEAVRDVSGNATGWETVGDPGISEGSAYWACIGINNSIPYVAYFDFWNRDRITVLKYDEKKELWDNVGDTGISADEADTFSLDFAQGVPYIAFCDKSNRKMPIVIRYSAKKDTWEAVGRPGLIEHNIDSWPDHGDTALARSTSMSIDNGVPCVAYTDYDISKMATVVKYNEKNRTWGVLGSKGFSGGGASPISLFAHGGTPYVAYPDDSIEMKAAVMRYNAEGDNWENVGEPNFAVVGKNYGSRDHDRDSNPSFSLYVDNNVPYFAFRDYDNSGKLTVMKYNEKSGKWEPLGSPGFSQGEVYGVSMKVYEGIPYVAYSAASLSKKAAVIKYNEKENAWELVGEAGISKGEVIDKVALDIYDGIPYVAYSDHENDNKLTVMRYK